MNAKTRYIEPERGATYASENFAVYEYDTYPRSSVLAGQTRRVYVDGGFESVEQAQAKYPDAELSGSRYEPPYLNHLPDPEGPDPYGDNEEMSHENDEG